MLAAWSCSSRSTRLSRSTYMSQSTAFTSLTSFQLIIILDQSGEASAFGASRVSSKALVYVIATREKNSQLICIQL